MSLKDISFIEFWQTLCLVEQNHLCNFRRGHHEEQNSEIILNLDQWFRRSCCLYIFLIWNSGGHPVQWSKTIYAILKEGTIRNIHVKIYEI